MQASRLRFLELHIDNLTLSSYTAAQPEPQLEEGSQSPAVVWDGYLGLWDGYLGQRASLMKWIRKVSFIFLLLFYDT